MALRYEDGKLTRLVLFRFWDISPQILALPSPLRFEYPSPLPHLTISVTNLIRHPSLRDLPLSQLYNSKPDLVRVTGVQLSRTSLECLIQMSTGEVIVYKFAAGAKAKAAEEDDANSPEDYFGKQPEQDSAEYGTFDEITKISHLGSTTTDGFKPVLILTAQQGAVLKSAMTDVGKRGARCRVGKGHWFIWFLLRLF